MYNHPMFIIKNYNRVFKILSIISISLLTNTCSSFGTVSMSYDSSLQKIWLATEQILVNDYGGILELHQNPTTAISKIKRKDEEFGLEKTSYQAFVTVRGFSRPYSVDVQVREYSTEKASDDFSNNTEKAGEILDQIKEKLEKQEATNIIKDFKPY
jgi:hypothetical protein